MFSVLPPKADSDLQSMSTHSLSHVHFTDSQPFLRAATAACPATRPRRPEHRRSASSRSRRRRRRDDLSDRGRSFAAPRGRCLTLHRTFCVTGPDLFDRRSRMMRSAPVSRLWARLELHRLDVGTADNEVAFDHSHGERGHRGPSMGSTK
jgi:hypothetical protein